MCKKMRKREKEPRPGLIITYIILFFIVILSFASLAVIAFMYWRCPQYMVAGAEASLLSNGLSIISLVVSVWVGLSIANVIQREEINRLNRQMQLLAKNLKEANETWISNQSVAIKNMFLQELLHVRDDRISLYFYQQFSDTRNEDAHWDKLIKIERFYVMTRQSHNASLQNDELQQKTIIEGLKSLKELSSQGSVLESTYKTLREAGFHFYQGYTLTYHESYYCFKKVIEIYKDYWKKKLGTIPVGVYSNYQINHNRELAVYLANAIGESYSKITQNYQALKQWFTDNQQEDELLFLEESPIESISFAEKAVAWSAGTLYEKNEVIYRNLGCAYERLDRVSGNITHNMEIFKNYQVAFRLMVNDHNILPYRMRSVYHVLLSYYMRYLDSVFLDKLDVENNEIYLNNATPSSIDCERIIEFLDYANFARADGKQNHLLIVMKGFAYFFAGVAIKQNSVYFNGITFEICIDEVNSAVATLELLESKDDYSKKLKLERDLLQNMRI